MMGSISLRCAIERQALMNDLNRNKKQLGLKSDARSQVGHLLVPLTSIREHVTTVLGDYGSPITAVQTQHLETVPLDVKRLTPSSTISRNQLGLKRLIKIAAPELVQTTAACMELRSLMTNSSC
jgi:hypothetical protein